MELSLSVDRVLGTGSIWDVAWEVSYDINSTASRFVAFGVMPVCWLFAMVIHCSVSPDICLHNVKLGTVSTSNGLSVAIIHAIITWKVISVPVLGRHSNQVKSCIAGTASFAKIDIVFHGSSKKIRHEVLVLIENLSAREVCPSIVGHCKSTTKITSLLSLGLASAVGLWVTPDRIVGGIGRPRPVTLTATITKTITISSTCISIGESVIRSDSIVLFDISPVSLSNIHWLLSTIKHDIEFVVRVLVEVLRISSCENRSCNEFCLHLVCFLFSFYFLFWLASL